MSHDSHDGDLANGDGDVRIERTFDAPAELIWAMWTESDHFAAWYGPTGATVSRAEMDVRVGGRRDITMEVTTPDGPMEFFFVGEYVDVAAATRLAYTDAMADATGTALTAEQMGMPAGTPTDTTIVIEFRETDGRTTMTLTHVGVASDSPGGRGWAMAIDKLEERVRRLSS